tara:strand:+ start:231 stop:527 length:297 start_codon:yes stop_codon:yes gene_type:complete
MLLNDFSVLELRSIYSVISHKKGFYVGKFYLLDKSALIQALRDSNQIIEKKEHVLMNIKNTSEVKAVVPKKLNHKFKYGRYYDYSNEYRNKSVIISFD